MAQAPTIGVVFNAVDNTTAAIKGITDRLEAFQKRTAAAMEPMRRLQAQVARFGEISGINRAANATNNLARAGFNAYQKLGQVVPLLGVIGSAASVAGIERMASAWANWGNNLANASRRIGVTASQLSALQGASQIAGSTGEAMTAGLQGLGQSMYDAIGGRNPAATVMFNTLRIGFRDAEGHARNTQQVLFEVADKISHMHNPFAEQQVLGALGIPAELLPAMQKGAAGLRAYMEDARRLDPVTDAMTERAQRLHAAMTRVSKATKGFADRLMDRLEPVMTPLLNHFAEWIATSPAVAHGIDWIGKKAEQLGHWIENGGIERFGATLSGWIEPIGAVAKKLGLDGGLLGALELVTGAMGASFALKVITPFLSLAGAIGGVTSKLAILAATSPPAWVLAALGAGGLAVKGAWSDAANVAAATGGGAVDRSNGTDIPMFGGDLFGRQVGPDGQPSQGFFERNGLGWMRRLAHPGGASEGVEPTFGRPSSYSVPQGAYDGGQGRNRPSRNNNPGDLQFVGQPGAVREPEGRFARFNTMGDGVAAAIYQSQLYQDRDHLSTVRSMMLKAGPPSDNPGIMAGIDRMAKEMGIGPDTPFSMHDPRMARLYIRAWGHNEGANVSDADLDRGWNLRLGAQGAPVQAPQARGAPLKLDTQPTARSTSNGGVDAGNGWTGRLHITTDKGVNVKDLGSTGTGPIVITPGLLGAQP